MAESLRALVEAVREARKAQMDGCYCGGDEEVCRLCGVAAVRESELATHLLTHPEAVEAYEAVLAYGLARKAAHGGEEMTEEQWRASLEDRAEKHRAIFALADRLAAKGGE